MKIHNAILYALIVAVFLAPLKFSFAQSLETYDDFNGNSINPRNWDSYTLDYGSMTDAYRGVTRGSLSLRQRTIAPGSRAGANLIGISIPDDIAKNVDHLAARVRVDTLTGRDCDDGGESGYSGSDLWMDGFWFKDSNYSSLTDMTGVVIAGIQLYRYSDNSSRTASARVQVDRCDDAFCTTVTNLFEREFGRILLANWSTLVIKHDKSTAQLLFEIDNRKRVWSYGNDGISASLITGDQQKSIYTTAGLAPTCGLRRYTSADARVRVDWVKTNPL